MKMGGIDEANIDMMRRIQSSLGNFSKQNNQHDTSNLSLSQMCNPNRHFTPNVSNADNGKRSGGIPPSYPIHTPPVSPFSQIPASRNAAHQLSCSQSFGSGPSQGHSRSLSQSSFFSFDALPPLSPSLYRGDSPSTSTSDQCGGLVDVSMEDKDSSSHSLLLPRGSAGLRVGESLPPRKSHRRSNSDISFGFSTVMQASSPFLPLKSNGGIDHMMRGRENPGFANLTQFVKTETTSGDSNNIEGEMVDDLFSAYMNLDNIDAFTSGADEKHWNENREDSDSRASGTKTHDSSENEAESSVNLFNGKRESVKRSAGCDIAPTTRHYRSLSMDSFMDKMQFGDESQKFPPIGTRHGLHSPSNSKDGNGNSFSLEFGNGEFSGAELNKIMANDKLAELAISDPKRVKRILANRQSAARSKERKMRYISDLEHKVQTLQTEATTLSAQLTMLQRDSVGLTSQNHELKFRIHSMEQQGKLRDALNETLAAEVQRLKLTSTNDNSHSSKCSVPRQAFQMAQQQQQSSSDQLNLHQMQLQEPQKGVLQPRDDPSKTNDGSK